MVTGNDTDNVTRHYMVQTSLINILIKGEGIFMKKRLLGLALSMVMVVSLLAGCGGSKQTTTS